MRSVSNQVFRYLLPPCMRPACSPLFDKAAVDKKAIDYVTHGKEPDEYVCPLSLEFYQHPVRNSHGFSAYEYKDMQRWLQDCGPKLSKDGELFDPMSNVLLTDVLLRPDKRLEAEVRYFQKSVQRLRAQNLGTPPPAPTL